MFHKPEGPILIKLFEVMIHSDIAGVLASILFWSQPLKLYGGPEDAVQSLCHAMTSDSGHDVIVKVSKHAPFICDNVYLQVQLVREPGRVSEPLELDTRQAPPLAPRPWARPLGHPGLEAVVGALAALLLFGILALLVSTRHTSSSSSLKAGLCHDTLVSDHFKCEFSPVLDLIYKMPLFRSQVKQK